MVAVGEEMKALVMATPGAKMSTHLPKLLPWVGEGVIQRLSDTSVAATVIDCGIRPGLRLQASAINPPKLALYVCHLLLRFRHFA